MRWLPKAIPILIGIIALDFTLVFGFEALRILASPISGLEQPAFARVIFRVFLMLLILTRISLPLGMVMS